MTFTCKRCDKEFEHTRKGGRQPKYCSDACKQAGYRSRQHIATGEPSTEDLLSLLSECRAEWGYAYERYFDAIEKAVKGQKKPIARFAGGQKYNQQSSQEGAARP